MKKICTTIILVVFSLALFAQVRVYPPQLTAPDNGDDYQPANVLLDWVPVTGTLGLYYEVQVSTDEGFTNPMVFTTDLSSYEMSELGFITEYWWRVRAIDSEATSDWSEVWSFTTFDVVELYRPKDGDDEQDPNAELIWDNGNDISGIDYYEVEIDTTPDFNSPEYHLYNIPFINDTNSLHTSDLFFGETYFWRVRAAHGQGVTDWSEIFSFEVLFEFELKRPKDEAVDQMPDQELKWDPVDGITAFIYQFSKDESFSNYKQYEAVENKSYADSLDFGTEYFWRGKAYHQRDTTDWTEVLSFTVIDYVELGIPENEQGNLGMFPQFRWNAITGVRGYHLQISLSPDFTNPISKTIMADGSNNEVIYNLPGPALQDKSQYFWRVNAFHGTDVSGWSDTWTFYVGTIGIDDGFTKANINIYPNPAKDVLYLQINSETTADYEVSVLDLSGQVIDSDVVTMKAGENTHKLETSQWANGIYMMQIKKDDQVITKKLVVNK